MRAYELQPKACRLPFTGGRKRAGDSYLECVCYLAQAFEKGIASDQDGSVLDLNSLMVMEQLINVDDKQLVATCSDDHVLAHRLVPQTENWFPKEGGPRGSRSGGSVLLGL